MPGSLNYGKAGSATRPLAFLLAFYVLLNARLLSNARLLWSNREFELALLHQISHHMLDCWLELHCAHVNLSMPEHQTVKTPQWEHPQTDLHSDPPSIPSLPFVTFPRNARTVVHPCCRNAGTYRFSHCGHTLPVWTLTRLRCKVE